MAESGVGGVRPVVFENVREVPVEILTFRNWDTRDPGPTLTLQPGESCRMIYPIAGFRLVRHN